MGWPEEQTLNSDIAYILAAYEGRVDMLKAIFGSSDKPEMPKNPTEKIGSMFDSMMAGKNRADKSRRKVTRKRGNS